jgi:hypothetical protein
MKLIDRGGAIDALTDTNIKRNLDSVYDDDIKRIKRAAQRVIAQVPVVDAVPVIRCRDCTYYDSEPGGDIMMCYNGCGWTEQNDFCSKGERRDSE